MTSLSSPSNGDWTLRRFQINKRAAQALQSGHPWVFRRQCSTALQALPVGTFVRLVGPDNSFVAIGLYEPLSAVAIRVLTFDDVAIDVEYFKGRLQKIWAQRKALAEKESLTGFRWIHGEADGFPGLNIDVYDNIAVAVVYLSSWQIRLQAVLQDLAKEFGLKKIYARLPHGQKSDTQDLFDFVTATLEVPIEPVWFQEGRMRYPAFLVSGQKSGFYLDLREVRRELASLNLQDGRVLNLFASSGMLSGLAEKCGAKEVVSVEASAACQIQFKTLQDVWALDVKKQIWLKRDVWKYFLSEEFLQQHKFDCIILDPPSLAKNESVNLQRVWQALVKNVLGKLKLGGHLFSICCTDRISETQHKAWTTAAAQKLDVSLRLIQKLPTPFDHPVHPQLQERDYFHAFHWQNVA